MMIFNKTLGRKPNYTPSPGSQIHPDGFALTHTRSYVIRPGSPGGIPNVAVTLKMKKTAFRGLILPLLYFPLCRDEFLDFSWIWGSDPAIGSYSEKSLSFFMTAGRPPKTLWYQRFYPVRVEIANPDGTYKNFTSTQNAWQGQVLPGLPGRVLKV